MSSIIKGYEYDIFISYRQNDNKRDGWVTEFIKTLQDELEVTVKGKISIYFDENPFDGLGETHDVNDSLAKKLKCLIFIPIISKTYCDPNCYAWTNEFLAFNELAKNDDYGLKITLPNGNTASRVLPIRIHEIDVDDKKLVEDEIGFLRSIDFVYQEPGVNRPLKLSDSKDDNLNKTSYPNQINKVANAIQEIISGIKAANEMEESVVEDSEKPLPKKPKLTTEIKRRNVIRASLVYILAGLLVWKVSGVVGLSDNIIDIVPLILIILFPIAMLMAWLYERSPDGFIRTGSQASRSNPFTDAQKKPLTSNTFILLLLATVAALFVIYPQNDSQTATASEVRDKSIAVLPFKDMSPAGDQEYLGNGLAEEILNRLTKIPDLKVIGRTSSFQFKGDKIDLREIGDKLGVTTVLEGSVQKSGNRIRITAQLINVADGSHIWSDRYDRDLTDIFQLQDDIAKTITNKLKLTFSDKIGMGEKYQPNQEAYDSYLKGIYFLNKRGSSLLRAREYFSKAVALDSLYALAFASLSQTYILIHYYEVQPPDGQVEKAIEYAEKALSLDENSTEAYASLGYINIFGLWDLEEAGNMLTKSLTINPEYGIARSWFGIYLIIDGKLNEAEDEARMAIEMDPLSPIPWLILAFALMENGKYEEAIIQSRYGREIAPIAGFEGIEMRCLLELDRLKEALDVWENSKEKSSSNLVRSILPLYRTLGETEKIKGLYGKLRTRSKTEYVSSLSLGLMAWYANDHKAAYEFLKLAIINKNAHLIYYLNDAYFVDNLDPELLAFIKKEIAAQRGQ